MPSIYFDYNALRKAFLSNKRVNQNVKLDDKQCAFHMIDDKAESYLQIPVKVSPRTYYTVDIIAKRTTPGLPTLSKPHIWAGDSRKNPLMSTYCDIKHVKGLDIGSEVPHRAIIYPRNNVYIYIGIYFPKGSSDRIYINSVEVREVKRLVIRRPRDADEEIDNVLKSSQSREPQSTLSARNIEFSPTHISHTVDLYGYSSIMSRNHIHGVGFVQQSQSKSQLPSIIITSTKNIFDMYGKVYTRFYGLYTIQESNTTTISTNSTNSYKNIVQALRLVGYDANVGVAVLTHLKSTDNANFDNEKRDVTTGDTVMCVGHSKNCSLGTVRDHTLDLNSVRGGSGFFGEFFMTDFNVDTGCDYGAVVVSDKNIIIGMVSWVHKDIESKTNDQTALVGCLKMDFILPIVEQILRRDTRSQNMRVKVSGRRLGVYWINSDLEAFLRLGIPLNKEFGLSGYIVGKIMSTSPLLKSEPPVSKFDLITEVSLNGNDYVKIGKVSGEEKNMGTIASLIYLNKDVKTLSMKIYLRKESYCRQHNVTIPI